MSYINTYLTFNGNCRDAMTFYKNCLGGELELQTIGDSPLADQIPLQMKSSILHSILTKGNLIIMASDMVGDNGLHKGNSVSLMLNCDSEEEAQTVYKNLSQDGKKLHPLEISFWGALFGDLSDKYGNQWLIHYDKNRK